MNEEQEDTPEQEWYWRKSEMMAQMLGPEYDMVMHAIIPYAVGGTLDLYYFPNGIPGTAIATKELTVLPGQGPSNRVFDTYELVMFTRHQLSKEDALDPETPFGRAHQGINAMLNHIARYSEQATLNPCETSEFPPGMEVVGGRCLIFYVYPPDARQSEFGLLLLIEIHRSEMEYARKNGSGELLAKLNDAGYYPYSDLDRPPVV